MRYKRKEYFRYVFEEPLPAKFKIKRVKDQFVKTAEGDAEIIDLSPSGLKLCTALRIQNAKRYQVELMICFKLNDKTFNVMGQVVWSEKCEQFAEYGIEFHPDQEVSNQLVDELKVYTREQQKE